MTTIETFAKAARYNSGSHPLDSGGAYGRHHENPTSPADLPLVTLGEYGATINTAKFLAEHLDVDNDLQDRFDRWAKEPENDDLSWFEAGEKFATEVLGLVQRARDNTYNQESDLSQVYIWEVYTPEQDCNGDWLCCDDDTLTVIYIHTGCDVRGGYSYPLFCRPQGEFAVPLDLCAGYYAYENNADRDSCDISEKWQVGYSSYPFGEFDDDCKRKFFFTGRQPDECIAVLNDGTACKVVAEASVCH